MRHRPNVLILGLAVTILLVPNAGSALAQPSDQTSATDMSRFVAPPDTIGDAWVIARQEYVSGYQPAPPLKEYTVTYADTTDPDTQPAVAYVSLFLYADRPAALASLDSQSSFWGPGTTIQDLTGYGDGPTFRAYAPGNIAEPQTSGITLVDGSVVAYVQLLESGTQDEADALCDSLAAAEDALLQAVRAAAQTPAAASAASPGGVPTSGIMASLSTSPLLNVLKGFSGPILVPPAGLQPFASLTVQVDPDLSAPPANYSLMLLGGTRTTRWVIQGNGASGGPKPSVPSACDPSANYCTVQLPGGIVNDEIFRGLQVLGANAVVDHGFDPGGESWSVYWTDEATRVAYQVLEYGAPEFPPKKFSANNRADAEKLAGLANQLVAWSGS